MQHVLLRAEEQGCQEGRVAHGLHGLVPKQGSALLEGRFFFNWDYNAQPLSVNRMRMEDRVKTVRFMGRKRYRSEDRRYD